MAGRVRVFEAVSIASNASHCRNDKCARAVLAVCSALARLGIDEEPTLREIKHSSERGRAAVDMAYAIRVN